jgi:hypothetical protein
MRDVDIMAVTETKLLKTDKIIIEGFSIIRKERNTDTRGGGVAILVKRGIPYIKAQLPVNEIECAAINLANKTTIVVAYNRPINKYKADSIHKILNSHTNVIIAGDLNSKHIDWGNNYSNTNGVTLKNIINNSNITLNCPPTHTHHPSNNTDPSTIDFFLIKNINNYTSAATIQELPSDHYPVEMSISNVSRENLDKYITSYKDTDWKKFRKTLDSLIKINSNIKTTNELDTEINKFTYQRTGNNTYKIQLQNLNRTIKTQLTQHKNERWENILKKATTRDNSLWKIAKSRTKKRSEIPPLIDTNTEAISDEQKSECLASHFQQVHNNNFANNTEHINIENIIDNIIRQPTQTDKDYIKTIITNPNEVGCILRKLKTNKATGEDQIDNMILKNISRKTTVQLTYIINSILKLNHFPDQYKTAIVVPIPKAGKSLNKKENFRPISLLNSISKVIEKIMYRRFNTFLDEHNITQDSQFGFKNHHNTTQQIARISNDILLNFNQDKNTVFTLLDIEKAFDRVWIKGLLYKMHKAGLNVNFIKLMGTYLSDRKIKVRVNNILSSERIIRAGVPQGSVLGPSLFNFYIHDLPEFSKTNLALYADDTAIYAHSFYAQAALLQNRLHLRLILKFFDRWKLKLNESKTELITFSRKRTNNKLFDPFKINHHEIKPKSAVNYLGITLDSRLNFKLNIKNKLIKANNAIRTIYPLIKRNSKLSTENKIILYKALLRPIITYAAPVWSHLSDFALEPLEIFQNKCMRLIHNVPRYTNTQYLRDLSELPKIKDFILTQTEKFFKNTHPLIKTPNEHDLPQLKINRYKHKLIHQHI